MRLPQVLVKPRKTVGVNWWQREGGLLSLVNIKWLNHSCCWQTCSVDWHTCIESIYILWGMSIINSFYGEDQHMPHTVRRIPIARLGGLHI